MGSTCSCLKSAIPTTLFAAIVFTTNNPVAVGTVIMEMVFSFLLILYITMSNASPQSSETFSFYFRKFSASCFLVRFCCTYIYFILNNVHIARTVCCILKLLLLCLLFLLSSLGKNGIYFLDVQTCSKFRRKIIGHGTLFWLILALLQYHYQRMY